MVANQGVDGELYGVNGIDFWSLLLISVIEILCGLLFCFCRMIFYAHKDDTSFGSSKFARIMVVIGMFMWVLPILWVPIDVILSLHSDTARTINFYIIMSTQILQSIYLWVFCPISLAFYETESNESFCHRFCQAMRL